MYYGKHRGAMRKRLVAIREAKLAGREVDDDISDLCDPGLLAELHQARPGGGGGLAQPLAEQRGRRTAPRSSERSRPDTRHPPPFPE